MQDRFSVNLDGYAGVKMLINKLNMAQESLYRLYSNEVVEANAITTGDLTGNTVWMDEVTRPAILQNQNLSRCLNLSDAWFANFFLANDRRSANHYDTKFRTGLL